VSLDGKKRVQAVRVLIVGAGIGGLSAAIALRRRGIEPVLFERTTELTEIGAGIAIAANAMKALDSLGLKYLTTYP